MQYETTSGHTITLKALSPDLLMAVRRGVHFPDPPSYEVQLAGGAKQMVFHNETTIQTDEERAEWEAYKVKHAECVTLYHSRIIKLIIRRSVVVDIPDGWEQAQAEFGIEIPENEDEKKEHFVCTELIGGATDLFALERAVQMLSGFSAEELQKAQEFFRCQVERDIT